MSKRLSQYLDKNDITIKPVLLLIKQPLVGLYLGTSLILAGCEHTNLDNPEQSNLMRAAARMESSGDTRSAIALYENALNKTPEAQKLPIYIKLGKGLIEIGELERARKTFEEALHYDQDNQAKKNLARCYLLAGQPEFAAPIYERILAEVPTDAEALNGLGIVFDTNGDHASAQEKYRLALTEQPTDINIKGNLGLSLALSGQFGESLLILEPIGLRLEATRKERHNLGVAYALSGNTERASELFSKDLSATEVEENLHTLGIAAHNHSHSQKPDIRKINLTKMIASLPKEPEPQRATAHPCDKKLKIGNRVYKSKRKKPCAKVKKIIKIKKACADKPVNADKVKEQKESSAAVKGVDKATKEGEKRKT